MLDGIGGAEEWWDGGIGVRWAVRQSVRRQSGDCHFRRHQCSINPLVAKSVRSQASYEYQWPENQAWSECQRPQDGAALLRLPLAC